MTESKQTKNSPKFELGAYGPLLLVLLFLALAVLVSIEVAFSITLAIILIIVVIRFGSMNRQEWEEWLKGEG